MGEAKLSDFALANINSTREIDVNEVVQTLQKEAPASSNV